MNDSPHLNPKKSHELTSTISLHALREIKAKEEMDELVRSLSDEELSILNKLRDEDAMLIILHGPGQGLRFLIDKDEQKLGRDLSCDLVFDDVTVSRNHCSITKVKTGEGISFLLKDAASLNGTYVNGVQGSEFALHNGDEIHVGKFKLRFFTNLGKSTKMK